MEAVLEVVGLGRQLRTEHNLKVRQPLAGIHIVSHRRENIEHAEALQDLILDELNVKAAAFSTHESKLAELSAKANFNRLGKRLGAKVQKVNQAVRALRGDELDVLLDGKPLTLHIEGEDITLEPDDVLIDRKPREGLAVSAGSSFVVALDTLLNPDLVREGMAREFVNKVQNMRKTADYDIAQRIHVAYQGSEAVHEAVERHRDYISAEVLALSCVASTAPAGAYTEELDLNGQACRVSIIPA